MSGVQENDRQGVWLEKLAIREVLERFMRCDDDKAMDQMMELFDEEAVFQAGDGEHVGHDAIRAFISRTQQPDPPHWTSPGQLGRQPSTAHVCVNPLIEVDGDAATAESDFVVFMLDETERPFPAYVGRFRDHLRREESGRWLITNRSSVTLAPRKS
jgi:3-phenylpropionate/cinnamic acid dioxygenase small subunit